jgi:hypothetical protein
VGAAAMRRACTVTTCGQLTAGFSTLCELHKRTLRRHGHAEQTGVTSAELQPYRDRVAARRTKNPGNPTWALLERRWEALTGHAGVVLDSYAMGSPSVSYERQTAEQLVTLRDTVSGATLIDVALAMFAMWEQWPARFKSDKAFGFQLARRVRGLSDVNTGSSWNAKEERLKRTYRDVPPRVLESLAESFKLAFGVAGLRLAELDKKDVEGMKAERQELHDALKEMK